MARFARLTLLALVVSFALSTSAQAAEVTEYQLQYSPVGDTTEALLIVTAVLDPTASLPTTVTIPVPAGSTLLWSGELLGGSPMDDPARQATVQTLGGMDVYTFTVEQVRLAQVEVALGAPAFDGDRVSGSLAWINPGPEVLLSASVVAEPGARNVETVPGVTGEIRTNSIGETLHPLGSTRLAAGATYTIEASWERGGTESSESSALLPILVGILAVAVLALVAVIVTERTRARRHPDE